MRKIMFSISSKPMVYGLNIVYARHEMPLSHQSDSLLLDIFQFKENVTYIFGLAGFHQL